MIPTHRPIFSNKWTGEFGFVRCIICQNIWEKYIYFAYASKNMVTWFLKHFFLIGAKKIDLYYQSIKNWFVLSINYSRLLILNNFAISSRTWLTILTKNVEFASLCEEVVPQRGVVCPAHEHRPVVFGWHLEHDRRCCKVAALQHLRRGIESRVDKVFIL